MFFTFVIVAILSMPNDTYAADKSYQFTEKESSNTYGYEYFGKMSNKDSLQALYMEIVALAKYFHADSSKDADEANVFAVVNFEKYGVNRVKENAVIHGVKSSYAQKYAKKHGHTFSTKKLKK